MPSDPLGVWTRSDLDRGDLFLTFFENGRYEAAHGNPAAIVHTGTFALDDNLFTFKDGWDCAPLPDDPSGRYVLRLGSQGMWLFFVLEEDTCPDRPDAMKSFRWSRFIPSPTP